MSCWRFVKALSLRVICLSIVFAAGCIGQGEIIEPTKPTYKTPALRSCRVTPNPAEAGAIFQVRGEDFEGGQALEVRVIAPDRTLVRQVATSTQGQFAFSLSSSAAGHGRVEVNAIGVTEDRVLATCAFEVIADPDPPPVCRTCEQAGAECGLISDNCGGTLNCGTCDAPEACGGAGIPNDCGCTPTTCAAEGANCGTLPNGCGGTLNCGTCDAQASCGGEMPNRCSPNPCTPTTCEARGAQCGTISDECGSTLDCGNCSAPNTCGGNGVLNRCGCTPTTCEAEGMSCGSLPDGCGGVLNCGECGAVCGNGVLEEGETCDPISSCPSTCNDDNACTLDDSLGNANTCDLSCTHTPVTMCNDGDGCCPSGCSAANDSDCAPVSTCPGFQQIAAGGRFSCAISNEGQLYCWGENDRGGLGVGDEVHRPTPTPVGSDLDWAQVSAGLNHACAIKTSGALYCWGSRASGKLGTNTLYDQPQPMRVGSASDWQRVETSAYHTCALRQNGALYCWGRNHYGQLGNGTTSSGPTHQLINGTWKAIGMSESHTCAVRSDGALYCWGKNNFGQLGVGDTTNRLSPTRVGSANTWSSLSVNVNVSCGIQDSGHLYCWGQNDGYTLGLDDSLTRKTPTRVTHGPATWKEFHRAQEHACGLGNDGSLWCWGRNDVGQLGQGDTLARRLPTRVGSATNYEALAVSRGLKSFGGYEVFHNCALRSGDELWCWGGNERGQLGFGDLDLRTTPQAIPCECFEGLCGTCGDNVCESDRGEICVSCPIDCNTRELVCGNGECQEGETHDNCVSDCAPDTPPADWLTFENEVLFWIAEYRKTEVTCPSGTTYGPSGALSTDLQLQEAARQYAWELSYSKYLAHDSCNGRRPGDRAAAAGVTYAYLGENLAGGWLIAKTVVDQWIASYSGHCDILMDPRYTTIGLGYAYTENSAASFSRTVAMFKEDR